jgi:CBS domain containing-hemolysin-like protein
MGDDEPERPKPEAPQGGLEAQAERREMIKGVQELSLTTVKEVMLPRVDALFFPLDMERGELLETVSSCGHSRIPVYRDNVDNVVGVLYAKDLLRALVKGGDFELADLIRKPFFVPETKRIDSLLREFKRRRVHMAIVVDEYGGVSGIVCLEDIIEEIVGEIQDEFDDEKDDIIPLSEGVWICDARADLDELNEELGLSLPAQDFETLGGYLFDLFGRIPARSERIEKDGIRFTVQDMDGNRIISVKVQRLSPEEGKK